MRLTKLKSLSCGRLQMQSKRVQQPCKRLFVKPFEDAKAEAKAKEQQNKASDKASEAMAKAANGNLFENENKTTNNKK